MSTQSPTTGIWRSAPQPTQDTKAGSWAVKKGSRKELLAMIEMKDQVIAMLQQRRPLSLLWAGIIGGVSTLIAVIIALAISKTKELEEEGFDWDG
jgi:hypothetical protein